MTEQLEYSDYREKILSEQVRLYYDHPEVYTRLMSGTGGSGIRECVLTGYKWLIAIGDVVPIERLPVDEKKRFWEDAKILAAGNISNEECKKVAIALYTLNCVLNQ